VIAGIGNAIILHTRSSYLELLRMNRDPVLKMRTFKKPENGGDSRKRLSSMAGGQTGTEKKMKIPALFIILQVVYISCPSAPAVSSCIYKLRAGKKQCVISAVNDILVCVPVEPQASFFRTERIWSFENRFPGGKPLKNPFFPASVSAKTTYIIITSIIKGGDVCASAECPA
jgi:hypothetical protein